MPDHTSFPPPSVDEDALDELNRDGASHFARLVAVLGEPRHLTLSAWDAERTREWELTARPIVSATSGLIVGYMVSIRETANEFHCEAPALDAALSVLVYALDLGADLGHLRFEGEDAEWRMELGHFRLAGVPVLLAVTALW